MNSENRERDRLIAECFHLIGQMGIDLNWNSAMTDTATRLQERAAYLRALALKQEEVKP